MTNTAFIKLILAIYARLYACLWMTHDLSVRRAEFIARIKEYNK